MVMSRNVNNTTPTAKEVSDDLVMAQEVSVGSAEHEDFRDDLISEILWVVFSDEDEEVDVRLVVRIYRFV